MKRNVEAKKIISFGLIFSCIAFLFIGITGIADLNKSKITYGDLDYKEFTFVSYEIERDSKSGDTFYIRVKEQDTTLYVSNALTDHKYDDFDALEAGDKLFCYLDPDGAKNRVVEIKSDEMIISLEEYQIIYRKSGIGLIVIMSVLSISAVVGAILVWKSYKVKQGEHAQ